MTYKIDMRAAADGSWIEVHGVIDAAALAGIRAALATGQARRVVLKAGCWVGLAMLEELRRLAGVELVAESPYLARWLETR